MRIVFVCTLMLLVLVGAAGPMFAASEKPKKDIRQPRIQPVSPDRKAPIAQSKAKPNKSRKGEEGRATILQSQSNKSNDKVAAPTGRKKAKKMRPRASVQPKPDLSYHGILERPQRYDPRPDRHKRGARNPHTSELLHEHFQELDKNQDGMLDPFERALGRLDMDRDMSNRQWE